MPRLRTLPTRLAIASTHRVPVLDVKGGATPRIRGRVWMQTRVRVAAAHQFACAVCGRFWNDRIDQIDHKVPLERGGSNDDSNLHPLCDDCHKAKTADEARRRAGRGY